MKKRTISKLKSIFGSKKVNGITLKDIGQLSQDHLREICPKIGDRIKLSNKIDEYLESKIDDDFAFMYPDKVKRFKDCWKLFMENVIELKKEEINSEEHKKNLLMSLNSQDIDGKKEHQQQNSTKSSRNPSPEPAEVLQSHANGDLSQPLLRTPPPSRVGPPPSPPVPTHPRAPVAPEPSGPLPLLPCQVCGRTFVPQSLAKHVKICEKMTVKKRKTFDSSRQRREGTDLEQYLPKNFGLPENSPFLEKSPPVTAKATPKPKPQTVRNAITKPIAELQRCPHCNRAFGVRAFERHVEWCADKAKILPAAPAQPPPHIADAKQRLNARTQYKAPPVRGRRSSQSRDKSSNSRSASVESSRGVSPPPPPPPPAPRDSGDYRRTRASESVSSNDCHEDTSPHIPVIRNSRTSQNKSSGDANVKARQARLARDLSSSRSKEDPNPSTVQQSNTNPNLVRNVSPKKIKNRYSLKKQQQLKKLEQIASKYSERNKKESVTVETLDQKMSDKSQIPLLKKGGKRTDRIIDKTAKDDAKFKTTTSCDINVKTSIPNPSKTNLLTTKGLAKHVKDSDAPKVIKQLKLKVKKENSTLLKESSMSLDSLEDHTPKSGLDKAACQSIGTNTDLLCPCVPCIIHDTVDPKKASKKKKILTDSPDVNINDNVSEPKIELLYKNPVMVSSCDIQITEHYNRSDGDSKEHVSISKLDHSVITTSKSENLQSEATNDLQLVESIEINTKNADSLLLEVKHDLTSEKIYENFNDLSAEHLEECYENDMHEEFDDSIENKCDDNSNEECNDIACRHGSGDTYTKFTDNQEDLDEFINLTDKMMSNEKSDKKIPMDENIENFHTPNTNSLEALYKSNNDITEPVKKNFSDTFEELKSNLKELLEGTNEKVDDETDAQRKVSDMEHITVYELKLYDKKPLGENYFDIKEETLEFKLPLINEKNNKPEKKNTCTKKRMQKIYKSGKKYKMLGEQNKSDSKYQTFIVKDENSDQSACEPPPLKLPRIENKRLDDNYDPFVSAARQMKELMSSDTNIPQRLQNSKDHSRTLPSLRPEKEKTPSSYLRTANTKMMKDTLNKTYQKTPTLHRMKSFGSTNNDNNSTSPLGRCSSFRINRNDRKSSQQKLNTTFTKSSKENVSTVGKSNFSRNNSLNRSFSSYTASCNSTPKPKDKIPKIATSMYHSFQRSTIKQPLKLDKIKKDEEKKDFITLDLILADDTSSMTDSNYIDPRLINENDNLPINVNTILNNPDIISSMESLLTTENLPAKFDSFNRNNKNNNYETYVIKTSCDIETNNNANLNKTAPIVDDLCAQYDKIMSSLEQSIASKTSVRDDDSLCEDFDLEEFMTTFDDEIIKHKNENKRTCSSTTRVVKQAELSDSKATELNSGSPSPKLISSGSNGLIPVNKSMSLNFSSNNVVSENLFPSSVKRSTSLLDSIQKKNTNKTDSGRSRHKTEQLEQDLMQSLKDFDRFYESEKTENSKNKEVVVNYNVHTYNGTAKRVKCDRKSLKKIDNASNGSHTPNGKISNDSAYSSLNRVSPSKLSLCNAKEPSASPEQSPAVCDSGAGADALRDDVRSTSSDEFLAMERSAERDDPLAVDAHTAHKEGEDHTKEKRVSSRASSRRSPTWARRAALGSSSGSETSLRVRRDPPTPAPAALTAPRLSRFCHECGCKFPVDTAKFCIECGVRRLAV